MPLESGDTIESLDQTYPLGGDPHNKGDDHLRLIKHVLKAQFVGVDGGGFKEAITATEQELNWLGGLTSNAQDQLDALESSIALLTGELSAPAGTVLSFYNTAPPNGWTQDTSKNDFMMRVVSTTGGGSGGTDSPILNSKVPSHLHSFSANTSTTGAHVHPLNIGGSDAGGGRFADTDDNKGTLNSNSAGSHAHSVSGNTSNNSGASNWTPKYVDMIICTYSG